MNISEKTNMLSILRDFSSVYAVMYSRNFSVPNPRKIIPEKNRANDIQAIVHFRACLVG